MTTYVRFIEARGTKLHVNYLDVLESIRYWADQRRKVDGIRRDIAIFAKESMGMGGPSLHVGYVAEKTMQWYRTLPQDHPVREGFPAIETDYELLKQAETEGRFVW